MANFRSKRHSRGHEKYMNAKAAEVEAELMKNGDQSPEAFDAAIQKALGYKPRAPKAAPTSPKVQAPLKLVVLLDRRLVEAGVKVVLHVCDTKLEHLAQRGYEVFLDEQTLPGGSELPYDKELPFCAVDPLDERRIRQFEMVKGWAEEAKRKAEKNENKESA